MAESGEITYSKTKWTDNIGTIYIYIYINFLQNL